MIDAAPKPRELTSFDGTRVQWLELGRGRPILVSSPLGLPFEFWRPLLSRLCDRHRFIFVKRRGLWGAAVPVDLARLDVEAHARDLALVVEACGHRALGMIGYCSGVAPLVRSLALTATLPERLLLLSGRYCPGRPVCGERWLAQLHRNQHLRDRLVDVLAHFAPPSLREALSRELGDPARLEAHVMAVDLSRRFEFDVRVPPAVATTFCYAEHDYPEIISSTEAYVRRLERPPAAVVQLPGVAHFYVEDDVAATARVVDDVFAAGAA